MNKISSLFLTLILMYLCFAGASYAAPTGGTNRIVDGSLLALAIECDSVFERNLKSPDILEGKINDAYCVYGKLSFKVTDCFNVYVKAGGADFQTDIQLSNGKKLEEDYNIGFYTGFGAKLFYRILPCINATVDGQVDWWQCGLNDLSYEGSVISAVDGDTSSLEFQGSVIFSYAADYDRMIHPVHGEWPRLIPYVGAAFSYLRIDQHTSAHDISYVPVPVPARYENDNYVGLVCGFDAYLPSFKNFMLNVEGRFFNELAVSGNISYTF